MERMLKSFWVLVALLVTSGSALAGNGNDPWAGLMKKLVGKHKDLYLTSSRETAPNIKVTPKIVSFKGQVRIPSYLKLSKGAGQISNVAAQIIFDNQVTCSYSPRTANSIYYHFVSCSDASDANDAIEVHEKIEVRLNSASSTSAILIATIKVLRIDEIEYGIIFPWIEAEDGQVLAYNGEAWVPTDVSELISDQSPVAGPPGPMGPQGLVGPMGPMGPQGPQGEKGEKGEQGVKGDKGDNGAPGVAGAQGPAGPIGPAGAAGANGAVGPQGPVGAAGSNGAIGPQGPAGAAGAIGPQGPKGDLGVAGATGSIGPMGPQGAAGAAGAAGSVGPMGPAGSMGATGPAGATGSMGPMGPMGPTGATGPAGAAGVDGLPGPQGPAGATGSAGATGPKGDKGDRGLSEIAYLRDEKASGQFGGTCNIATWNTRALNVLGGDTSFITMASNRFVLQPGKYFIEIQAPTYQANISQAKLKVIETNTDVMFGSIAVSNPTNPSLVHSIIAGEIVVAATSTFEIQQKCSVDRANTGFGIPSSFGTVEIYTQVKIIKKQ